MTREEHLKWCKQRALQYVDHSDLPQAYSSMASDMSKHPETKDHIAIQLGYSLIFAGHLDTAFKMREFIEGFN